MSALIVELVGLAVIVAASPFILIPMVVLLRGQRGTVNAAAYLAAVTAGTAGAAAVFLLVADLIDRSNGSDATSGWLRVIVGAALVLVAARQWLTRTTSAKKPTWLSRLDTATPTSAGRLGLLVSVANPKVLGTSAAAGALIASESLSGAQQVLAWAVFTVASVSGIAAIALARMVGGARGAAALQRLDFWLERHSTALSVLVLAVLGLLLLLDGISRVVG